MTSGWQGASTAFEEIRAGAGFKNRRFRERKIGQGYGSTTRKFTRTRGSSRIGSAGDRNVMRPLGSGRVGSPYSGSTRIPRSHPTREMFPKNSMERYNAETGPQGTILLCVKIL